MRAINETIDFLTGNSKYFDIVTLKNFKIVNLEDIFLMFLPNFSLDTPFHHLLININYDVFNNLAKELETNFKMFTEFLQNDQFIEKIAEMFIFVLEHKKSYAKEALKNKYCHLFFDGNQFDQYDDDSGVDEEDFENDDLFIEKLLKKNFSTKGSITRKNLYFISKLLMKVQDKIQNNIKFSTNTNFNVFK